MYFIIVTVNLSVPDLNLITDFYVWERSWYLQGSWAGKMAQWPKALVAESEDQS